MKKHILFILSSMATGGINRAMQNYLNVVDTSRYDIDLFVMVQRGVYKSQFNNCAILPSKKILDLSLARFDSKKGLEKLKSAVLKWLNKVTKGRTKRLIYRAIGNKLIRDNHYDAIIGYGEGEPTTFVSQLKHHNKISWIHCDYASYYKINRGKNECYIYANLNSVVCVSEFTRESFLSFFPDISERTYAIYNVLDDVMMKDKSLEPVTELFDDKIFNIVSVGRHDPVKRLSAIPEIARNVLDNDVKIRWYVIGPKGGNSIEYNLFCHNLKRYGVEKNVVLLGEKSNPYPYIRMANLLVNTSVSEACPYVINEAKILGTPVVCTNFGSAKEFIEYGVNGYFEPIDRIADAILLLANDHKRLQFMRDNLSHFKYNNRKILQQIDRLFN